MSKILWQALMLGPAVLGASLAMVFNPPKASATPASANDVQGTVPGLDPASAVQPVANLEASPAVPASVTAQSPATPQMVDPQLQQAPGSQIPNATGSDPAGRVNSVSQLSDVDTSSWAFQALQALVERYGCIAGYPDGTFRGNRSMTRYEFAAGMYACLNSLQERIGQLSPEELASVRRLQEEFAGELATLRGKVDQLEARTDDLDANQFSTTTKLSGEVVFAPAYAFGGNTAVRSGLPPSTLDINDRSNPIFGYRARLNFDSSFFGKDRLRVRLQARDIPNLGTVTGTNMSRLAFDGSTTPQNNLELDDLYYRFPLGENGNVYIAAANLEYNDAVEVFSPLESSGRGAISRFGRFNPIYRQGGDGTGIIANIGLSDKVTFSAGYLAPTAVAADALQEPGDTNAGLIGGEYAATAQLAFEPTDKASFGLTYVRSYLPSGTGFYSSVGGVNANSPFGAGVPITANSFGAEANLRLSPKFNLSGWAGYSLVDAANGTDNNADVLNYAITLAFPDLGKEGNLGAIVFGQPPKVISNTIAAREDQNTSYHIEGLYRFQVNDNISITPGLFVILNPEHNTANDPVFTGTIRTTFTF